MEKKMSATTINKFNSELGDWRTIQFVIEKLINEKKIPADILDLIIKKINELTLLDLKKYQLGFLNKLKESDYFKQKNESEVQEKEQKKKEEVFEDGKPFLFSEKNPYLWLQLALRKLERIDIIDKIFTELNNLDKGEYYNWIMMKKTIEWHKKGYLKVIDDKDPSKIKIKPTELGLQNLPQEAINYYQENFNGSVISKNEVVYLHDTKGFKFREISEKTEIPRTTLQEWYHKAKSKSDKKLEAIIN